MSAVAIASPAASSRLSSDAAEAVLRQWIVEADASDARMNRAGPGVASTQQWAGKTGL